MCFWFGGAGFLTHVLYELPKLRPSRRLRHLEVKVRFWQLFKFHLFDGLVLILTTGAVQRLCNIVKLKFWHMGNFQPSWKKNWPTLKNIFRPHRKIFRRQSPFEKKNFSDLENYFNKLQNFWWPCLAPIEKFFASFGNFPDLEKISPPL